MKHLLKVIKGVIGSVFLLFLLDLLLAYSGQRTYILNLHPFLLSFAKAVSILVVVLVVFKIIFLIIDKQWKKLIILTACIGAIVVLTSIATMHLKERTTNMAFQIVQNYYSKEIAVSHIMIVEPFKVRLSMENDKKELWIFRK
jgi:hypothetical protein